jgi:hypothetical protein
MRPLISRRVHRRTLLRLHQEHVSARVQLHGTAKVVESDHGTVRGGHRALVQMVGTSKHSLLRHADFRPEAPRSRLQVRLGFGRPNVLV